MTGHLPIRPHTVADTDDAARPRHHVARRVALRASAAGHATAATGQDFDERSPPVVATRLERYAAEAMWQRIQAGTVSFCSHAAIARSTRAGPALRPQGVVAVLVHRGDVRRQSALLQSPEQRAHHTRQEFGADRHVGKVYWFASLRCLSYVFLGPKPF